MSDNDNPVDHEAQTAVGPTQQSPLSVEALAYSQAPPLEHVHRPFLTPGRITGAAVVVSLVVVVAVATYAGYTLGRPSSPTRSASTSQASGAPKPPPLDGVYKFTYDFAKQTYNGTAAPESPGDATYWAFRSHCGDSICLASAIALEANNHVATRTPASTVNLQYIDGHWRSEFLRKQVDQLHCLYPGNRVAPGRDTISTYWYVEPIGATQLRGSQIGHVMTNECGFRGGVSDIPVTMDRIGDVPPTLQLPAPNPIKASEPVPNLRPGDLDGLYRFTIDFPHQTVNGKSGWGEVESATELWALRSVCTSSRCVTAAAQVSPDNPQQNTGIALMLDFVDGQWTLPNMSPQPPQACDGSAESDAMAMKWSLTKQLDGSLRGALTAVVVTNQCGREGHVYQTPMTAVRTGDVAPSVVLADPTLFVVQ